MKIAKHSAPDENKNLDYRLCVVAYTSPLLFFKRYERESMEHGMATTKINFKKAAIEHQEIIFQWLDEPHMREFWDNTQEHRDDILNFIHGRKQHYFAGTTHYWVGYLDEQPFCFILSDQILPSEELSDLHRAHLSEVGHTITIDFGIGNPNFLGKGLAATTLQEFTTFYQQQIDSQADTFFIDPDMNNPRAFHVYEKAGFKLVGEYVMKGGAFDGHKALLMVKK